MREFYVKSKKMANILNLFTLYFQFVVFSLKIRHEEHLLPQSPFNLLKQYLAGLSVIIIDNGLIVAHVTLWHLADGWYELGTVWVHDNYRCHGLGHKIISRILENNCKLRILSTSTNQVMKNILTQCNMQQGVFECLPQNIYQTTCICSEEKTGSCHPLQCKIKNKKCHLFVN